MKLHIHHAIPSHCLNPVTEIVIMNRDTQLDLLTALAIWLVTVILVTGLCLFMQSHYDILN